jgi:Transposase
MLHVGLDLSRRRLDVCVLSDEGELLEEVAAPPDAEGLRYLVSKLAGHREPVPAVIESMTGARFVHDTLEQLGWDVLIADAQRVKGLAPVACKTDRVDSRVLACSRTATWYRRSGCPIRGCVQSVSRRGFGCIWSSTSRCSSTASIQR